MSTRNPRRFVVVLSAWDRELLRSLLVNVHERVPLRVDMGTVTDRDIRRWLSRVARAPTVPTYLRRKGVRHAR